MGRLRAGPGGAGPASLLAWGLAVCVALTASGGELAADEPGRTPRALFEDAVALDEAGEAYAALEAYRAAIAADPSARFAARAAARVRALELLVGDPGLAALEAVRRDYPTIGAEEALRRAEAILGGVPAPSAPARAAIHDWLASEYALGARDPSRAVHHWTAIAADPEVAPGSVESALVNAARAAESAEDLRRVRDAIHRTRAARADLSPGDVDRALDEVRDTLQRRAVRPLSAAAITLLAMLALTRRSPLTPWSRSAGPFALMVWLFAGGAALSARWEPGYALPFVLALPAVAAVHLLGRAASPGSDGGPWTRALTGLIIALATFGSVFLVFDAFDRAAILGL